MFDAAADHVKRKTGGKQYDKNGCGVGFLREHEGKADRFGAGGHDDGIRGQTLLSGNPLLFYRVETKHTVTIPFPEVRESSAESSGFLEAGVR